MRRIAFEVVLRACAFGFLAIFCVMVGMSFAPREAFQAGGLLTLVMVGVLVLKARFAFRQSYRRTEMWLYLPKEDRPPEQHAQWASATVMRETYLQFAHWSTALAIILWSIALILAMLGF